MGGTLTEKHEIINKVIKTATLSQTNNHKLQSMFFICGEGKTKVKMFFLLVTTKFHFFEQHQSYIGCIVYNQVKYAMCIIMCVILSKSYYGVYMGVWTFGEDLKASTRARDDKTVGVGENFSRSQQFHLTSLRATHQRMTRPAQYNNRQMVIQQQDYTFPPASFNKNSKKKAFYTRPLLHQQRRPQDGDRLFKLLL